MPMQACNYKTILLSAPKGRKLGLARSPVHGRNSFKTDVT